MAISYNFEIAGEMLKVSTSGIDENLEEVQEYASAVLGLAKHHGCNKIFCDERDLVYNLSVIDTFQLAEAASKKAREISKIAIVCNEKYLEDGKFFETVSSNRGLIILMTSDSNHAIKWLE